MAKHHQVENLRRYECEAMACPFSFHLVHDDFQLLNSAVMEAEELLAKLEERLSLYIEYSDTTRINRAKSGDRVRVTQDTVDCLLQAFDASARLGGKFHPFLGQISIQKKQQSKELGRFLSLGSEGGANLMEPVVALDVETNTLIKLREGPLLDFGGIGKGFALDRLKAHFMEWEIEMGLLEAAGSSFLAMKSPDDNAGWELAIGYEENVRSIHLPEGWALASSGELFQESHVVDPQTGGSIVSPWKRSYAFAPNAALADAASTAAYLMNREALESIAASDDRLSFAVYSESDAFTQGSFFQ